MNRKNHLKILLNQAENGDLAACAELEAELMIDVEWYDECVSCVDASCDCYSSQEYSLSPSRQAARLAASTSVARQIIESEE